MSRPRDYRLNVVSFAPSFTFALAICMDSINVTGSGCFGWLVLEKLDGCKLARAPRSEPIIVPTVFPNVDAASVSAVFDVFSTPPMLRVLIRKLPAPLTAPSAEHCVGQFGYFSSLRCPCCQEQRSYTG